MMDQQIMNIVFVGHVDHGKSTIVGRLLADTNHLPEGRLNQIKKYCADHSKPFEYAFLLDALKDEQAQGITIDIARCFFKTPKRKYLILDAPGHIEFLKNLVTGASNAEAALLVIDAHEGIQENSKRHAYMLSMLGIKQLIVLVNKMDLIHYDKQKFNDVIAAYNNYLGQIGLIVSTYIPVSGREGDNIATPSVKMPWYMGGTVLENLDLFEKAPPLAEKPFRMPIQDIYRFTENGDARRIVAGKIESGTIKIGDRIIFYPSGKTSTVKSIEEFNAPQKTSINAGKSTGITLDEQIYVRRGKMAAKANEPPPKVASLIKVSLFWLGKKPLHQDKVYLFKSCTAKINAKLVKINRIIDASSLAAQNSKERVDRHEIAECIIKLYTPIALDITSDNPITSRFVMIDDYNLAGGGLILETLTDEQNWLEKNDINQNTYWLPSAITRTERAKFYQHSPALLILTGNTTIDFAKQLERFVFLKGHNIYFIGMNHPSYHHTTTEIGESKHETTMEHLSQFSEILNILLDTGNIVVTFIKTLSQDDINLIQMLTNCRTICSVWFGDQVATNLKPTLKLSDNLEAEKQIESIFFHIKDQIL